MPPLVDQSVPTVDASTSTAYAPLRGVRVLDLSRLLPGGIATERLAALGADVVKVEAREGGDYLRAIPPFIGDAALMFEAINRGKRSIALDVDDPEDRAMLLRLVGVADVVVESSRPGRFLAAGIDFAALRAERPDLVVCSITGFGQTGPFASLPAHGFNIDALAGVLPVAGGEVLELGTLPTSLGSELGAVNAALAISAAVLCARATGRGAWIDISCWDAAVDLLRLEIAHQMQSGSSLPVSDMLGPLYSLYETADGGLVLFAAIEAKFLARFAEAVGLPELGQRWSGGSDSVDFGADPTLRGELAQVFKGDTAASWQRRFVELGVPGTVVRLPRDLVDDDHAIARGLVDRSGDGFLSDPIRWHDSDTRPGAGSTPAPKLGADTADVVREWLGG